MRWTFRRSRCFLVWKHSEVSAHSHTKLYKYWRKQNINTSAYLLESQSRLCNFSVMLVHWGCVRKNSEVRSRMIVGEGVGRALPLCAQSHVGRARLTMLELWFRDPYGRPEVLFVSGRLPDNPGELTYGNSSVKPPGSLFNLGLINGELISNLNHAFSS